MHYLLGALACIAASGLALAQEPIRVRGATASPGASAATAMDALADTLFKLSPDARSQGLPTLASLRAASSPIRWSAAPKADGDALLRVGTLAGGTVTVPRSEPSEIMFDWEGPEGHPFGFDPIKALRKRGFKVQALYCAPMVSEGTNYFLISAPGKRPGFLSIYAFDAPMAISLANWSISYRLDGHVPSLEEVQAADATADTDCSSPTFGPVEQISQAEAVALARSQTQ